MYSGQSCNGERLTQGRARGADRAQNARCESRRRHKVEVREGRGTSLTSCGPADEATSPLTPIRGSVSWAPAATKGEACKSGCRTYPASLQNKGKVNSPGGAGGRGGMRPEVAERQNMRRADGTRGQHPPNTERPLGNRGQMEGAWLGEAWCVGFGWTPGEATHAGKRDTKLSVRVWGDGRDPTFKAPCFCTRLSVKPFWNCGGECVGIQGENPGREVTENGLVQGILCWCEGGQAKCK